MSSTNTTIHKLVRNGGRSAGRDSVTGLTGTTISTAKSLIVPYGVDDKIAFVVQWETTLDKRAARFTIKAGAERRAWQQGQGDATFTVTTTAAGRVYNAFIGPFETARFANKSTSTNFAPIGSNVLKVEFLGYQSTKGTSQPTTEAKGKKANIMAFRMPMVEYTT